ncbi:MAG: hypothetical protein QNM02_08015 [Acidimicrobiia bacterium]|nr:hypothetical protein [Acidimicrobiia bacterium]
MERLLVAGAIVVVVAVVALVARARRATDAPTQARAAFPQQVDRRDFSDHDVPWLVVVFSSATCDACSTVVDKANVLVAPEVAVIEVQFPNDRELHERYSIGAVPTLIVVDSDGITRAAFRGPMTATDLWAAVAEVREPGSTPASEFGCAKDHG